MYFFLKHMLSTEAKSELKDVEILEANWKTDMIDIWQTGRSCVLRKIFEG